MVMNTSFPGSEPPPYIPPPSPDAPTDDWTALYQSFFMILASEVGDKTFLIAAILSMRHPRLVVFLGAFSSLVVMSLLSAGMGQILPSLFLPPQWTHLGAGVLFLWFGFKMGKEGWEMEGGSAKVQEEMKEVEEEIQEDEEHEQLPMNDLESGSLETTKTSNGLNVSRDEEYLSTPSKSDFNTRQKTRGFKVRVKDGAHNFASLFLGPVFVQAFILTFLGEWGDRSQIATIALAAAHVCLPLQYRLSLAYLPIECVYHHSGNGCRPQLMHGYRGYWRSLDI